MIKDISAIKIGPVWNGGRGATFTDEILASPVFTSPIKLLSPIGAELLLIRMKEGVSVVLNNLHTSVEQQCARCLGNFEQELEITELEVHFYRILSPAKHDDVDQFLIDLKGLSIDLTEAIRQEIILHFPMIPVCSKRCKGLCPDCKVNLNQHKHSKHCNYQQTEAIVSIEDGGSRPFANLKDLFKN